MRLTKRGKRRLLLLFVVLIGLGVLLAGFVAFQDVYRGRLARAARAEGLAAFEQGEYKTALTRLSYAIARNKEDLEGLLAFGACRARVHDVNDRHLRSAVHIFQAALALDEDNIEALEGLLDLYGRLYYTVEQTDIADRLLAIDPDHIEALTVKAERALYDGRYDEVYRIVDERLAALEPQELRWRAFYIYAMKEAGASEAEILAQCDAWIEAHARDGRFHLLKAQMMAALGRVDESIEVLLVAADRGADSREVLESLVAALDAQSRLAKADELLDRARSTFAGESWVHEVAVRRRWQQLAIREGLEEIARARDQLDALTPGLVRWNALLSSSGDDVEAARAALRELRASAETADPSERDAARAWAGAIEARFAAGETGWLAVINAYEESLSVLPGDPVLQFLLAEAYQRVGEHDLAIGLLAELSRSEPSWFAVAVALTESQLAAGRPGPAFATISSLLQRSSVSSLGAWMLLGRTWLALGPSGEAVRLTNRMTGATHSRTSLIESLAGQFECGAQMTAMLAETYALSGDRQSSTSVIDEALANDACSSDVLLALVDVSQRYDLGRTETLIERLIEAEGQSTRIALVRATVLHDRGGQRAALELVEQTLASADAESAERESLRWLRARLLLELGHAEAGSEIVRLVRESTTPARAIHLLGVDAAWKSAELVGPIIEALQERLGQRSPRLKLAEATFLYRFEGDNPASVARAIGLVDNVLKVYPESRYATSLMATLLASGRSPDLQHAIRILRQHLSFYPEDVAARVQLAALMQRAGDFESASQTLGGLGSPAALPADVRGAQVRLLTVQGEFDRAIAVLESLPADVRTPSDGIQLIGLLDRTGRTSEAREHVERLLAAYPRHPEVITAVGSFLARNGELERALTLAESLRRPDGDAVHHRERARLCLLAADREAARNALDQAVALAPDDAETWRLFAELHLENGDLTAARDAGLRAAALQPDDASTLATLVVIGAELGSADRQSLLQRFDGLEIEDAALKETLRLFDRIGSATPDDLRAAKDLVRVHPASLPAWRVAITMHAEAGAWEEALRLARQAAGRLPAEPAPAEMAARLLIQLDQPEEALRMATLWRTRSANDPLPADIVIAALQLDRGRAEEAFRQLAPHADRLLRERRDHPDRFGTWLEALLASGRAEDALAVVAPLLDEEPDWSGRWIDACATLAGPPARRALTLIEPAVLPSDSGRIKLAAAWSRLGARTGSQSDLDHAAQLLTALPADPDYDVPVGLVRASIAEGRGDSQDARQAYRDVLARDPANVVALNNLAYLLVRDGIDCEEAARRAEEAHRRMPANSQVLETLVQALLCADRIGAAEETISGFLRLHPADARVHLSRARVYYRQGRASEAIAELDAAQRRLQQSARPEPRLREEIEALRGAWQTSALDDRVGCANHDQPRHKHEVTA